MKIKTVGFCITAGEYAENEVRKDFTPSERVAIGKTLEAEIGGRQGTRTDLELRRNCGEVAGRTVDVAAQKAGFGSAETYERAKSVIDRGSPELVQAMDSGDVSIHAATKYMVGHADAMLGVVTAADKETWFNVKATASVIGNNPGSEELYLGLRGLRTLQVRLRQHQESALAIATFLAGRPEVKRVLHPAFESCPGHETWKRDFTGASGLFSVVLDELFDHAAVARMLDGLEHFGMGFSWGGFESLAILAHPDRLRTAVPWSSSGPVIRFHAGLDDPDDLIADLDAGLRRLA